MTRYYNFESDHVATIYNTCDAILNIFTKAEHEVPTVEANDSDILMAALILGRIDEVSDAFQPEEHERIWLDKVFRMFADHDYEMYTTETDPLTKEIIFDEYSMARDIIRRLNITMAPQ